MCHTFRCSVILIVAAVQLADEPPEGTLVAQPSDVESISAEEGKRAHALRDAGALRQVLIVNWHTRGRQE